MSEVHYIGLGHFIARIECSESELYNLLEEHSEEGTPIKDTYKAIADKGYHVETLNGSQWRAL